MERWTLTRLNAAQTLAIFLIAGHSVCWLLIGTITELASVLYAAPNSVFHLSGIPLLFRAQPFLNAILLAFWLPMSRPLAQAMTGNQGEEPVKSRWGWRELALSLLGLCIAFFALSNFVESLIWILDQQHNQTFSATLPLWQRGSGQELGQSVFWFALGMIVACRASLRDLLALWFGGTNRP